MAEASDVLKIVSWNVVSLRNAWKKGLKSYIETTKPDIFCIQETKMYSTAKPPITDMTIPGYHGYFNHAERKGYSGTAIYTKLKPLSVSKSAKISDKNGRCMTIEFSKFVLLNTYIVNAGETDLSHLDYKIKTFNVEMESLLSDLLDGNGKYKDKILIWTGDLNVAHKDIDIWSAIGNDKRAGFTPEERQWFDNFLIKNDCIDVFRYLYPEKQQFTYFDFRSKARASGRGMRIDYFVMPKAKVEAKKGLVIDCSIGSGDALSDHNQVELLLDKTMVTDVANDKNETVFINEEIL